MFVTIRFCLGQEERDAIINKNLQEGWMLHGRGAKSMNATWAQEPATSRSKAAVIYLAWPYHLQNYGLLSALSISENCWTSLKAHFGLTEVTRLFGIVSAVKLLPCDHEVTGSSLGNSLLQKCMERLHTQDPKWLDPSPDLAQAGATCTGLPFLLLVR